MSDEKPTAQVIQIDETRIDPDDLLFREPARLHDPSPIRGDGFYPFLEELAGLRPAQPNHHGKMSPTVEAIKQLYLINPHPNWQWPI
jgi:hypothetical protein